MGKKKNKGGVTLTHHDQDDGDENGEERADTSAAAAAEPDDPVPPPPPPPAAREGEAQSSMPPPPAATPAVASISGNTDPSEMLREGMVVTGREETRYIAAVPYCEVCTMPYEFCEWGALFKKCKENFTQNHKKHFPDVEGEEDLVALMTRLGFEGGDAASKKAQTSKKQADTSTDSGGGLGGGTGGGGGKKKEKPPQDVVIELNNRNKKKHITVVKGLEHFGVDTAAAAKTFGKKFACGSALKKGSDGQPDSIEIQGNYRDELPALIVDKLKVSLDNIVLVVDGRKVKAADHVVG